MALVSDLMGLGEPGPRAALLGNTPQTVVPNAGGTTNATTASIMPGSNIVLFAPATSTANAAVLSTAWSLGTPVYILNAGTVTGSIFAPISGTLNAVASAAMTLSTARSAIFIQTTAGVWWTVPSTAQ